jgi:hypothetical protein
MAVAQHLHLRLFLEGVEVPVVSASIMSQKNAPAAASIQIPANDNAMELKPRTLVHLFFKDLYRGAPPESLASVEAPGVRMQEREQGIDPELRGLFSPVRFASTPGQDETDLLNEQYKLCFAGEMVGLQFQKTPTSRAVVLQCVDFTSYWDIAFQYQLSGFNLGGGGIRAAFTGAATTVFNNFLEGSADILVNNLMSRPPRSYPRLGGTLLGALVHIIEAIGGTYFGRRAVRGTNDFFSLAEMRLHLTQMVGANPYPQNNEIRLLRARGFGSLFRRSLSGLGKLVSVRQVLLALQKYIFHEHIPITSPRYLPPLTDPNLPAYETVGLEEDEATRPVARAASHIKARALEMKERQQRSTDSEQARTQSDRRGGLAQEIRRLMVACAQASRVAGRVGFQRDGEARDIRDFFGIREVHEAFATTATRFQRILELNRRGQRPEVRTYTFFPADSNQANDVYTLLDSIIDDMQRVLDSRHRRRVARAVSQPDPPPRLLSTLYRPDVWMVAPPRCNVIFPELYSSFNYARDFNAEVSRLLLRTHAVFMGSDILFDGFFMTPNQVVGARHNRPLRRGRTGQDPDYASAPAMVAKDLMDHELYTGIIPSFERMSDLNLHALRGRFARTDDGTRIPYAQIAANHIFFQYRFKSRQLNCSGKFNPYLAFGFPCVIVDKYLPVDRLRDPLDDGVALRLARATGEGEGDVEGLPDEERRRAREGNLVRMKDALKKIAEALPNTHYLGTPESLSHSIAADSGGTTQIQMGYARTTTERMEYFGENVRPGRRARRTHNRRVNHTVAALLPPAEGSRGPRGGQIVGEVRDVTEQYSRRNSRLRSTDRTATGQQRFRGGERLPLFVQDQSYIRSGRRRGTQVLVGVEQPAASYGPEVVGLVGTVGRFQPAVAEAYSTLVTFRAYRFTEEVGVYRAQELAIPPEEMVFPPWYGEHYKSQNIGGLYSYFFGVGAITDPLHIIAEGRNATRVAQTFDGRTIEGAEARAVRVTFAERFQAGATSNDGPVATGDELPPPGFSETAGEGEGPPGDEEHDVAFLGAITERSPVNYALDEVVRAYSLVKLNQFDVHQFLRAYTWRPIATMVDLFGTANLEIDDRGKVVVGREGFHSRAFGDFDDLRQLVGPGDGSRPQTVLGLTTHDPDERGGDRGRAERDQAIAARLDTRREKRIQVLRYLHALMAQRGVLG